jgi:hypothetical protein
MVTLQKENGTIALGERGAASFDGPAAVDTFRANATLQALKLYKLGIVPHRSVKKSTVMEIAGKYTGKVYRRGAIDEAIADMQAYLKQDVASYKKVADA